MLFQKQAKHRKRGALKEEVKSPPPSNPPPPTQIPMRSKVTFF